MLKYLKLHRDVITNHILNLNFLWSKNLFKFDVAGFERKWEEEEENEEMEYLRQL